MTEAATQPAQEPLSPRTLDERLDAYTAAVNSAAREMAWLRQAMTGALAEPVGPFDITLSAGRIADFQLQMRAEYEAMRPLLEEASMVRTLDELQESRLAAVPAPVPVPQPRSHRRAKRPQADRDGQRGLWPVGALAPVAAFLREGLKHPVTTVAGHVVTAQHVALAATAATLAVAAPLAVVAGVTGAGAGHPSSYAATPNPAASIVSATPIQQPVPGASIAALTRPVTDAKSSVTYPVPWYLYDPPSSSGSSQPSASSPQSQTSQVSVPAPPVIQVSGTGSLDLTSGTPATITVTAAGASGWASWKVDTGGSDLDFSPDHGVLQAGQSVVVTVSVDAAQAADGNLSQTFSVGGQTVTASLPPLAAAVPSPVDSIVPSPASS